MTFPGDEMPIADFCNSSETYFNDVYSFLPGENVIITCSVESRTLTWTSPNFSDPVILNFALGTNATRLNGTIVFELFPVPHEQDCVTSTATIVDIQESLQGLSLACIPNVEAAKFTINVVGKLVVNVFVT